MKWRTYSKPKPNPEDWHTWFAWKPVHLWSIKDDCFYTYWLCFLYRRKNHNYDWEYKTIVWY